MSAVVIKEGLVHYEVIGRGRPVVFLHGWLGSWRYWVPSMEDLSSNHRTYAFDMWGFGDSDKLNPYYAVSSYVDLLRDFLDQLGVWRVPLVGHSLGGVIALLFAAQEPERVEQVLGVSVPLMQSSINRPLSGFSGDGDALLKMITRRADFPEVSLEAPKTDTAAINSSVNSLMEYDLRDVIYPLEIPVLMVYGSEDPIISLPEEEWLSDFEDNVRFISLDSVQHFPMLEERNKFNRLLADFLEAGEDLSSLELKEEWQRRLR